MPLGFPPSGEFDLVRRILGASLNPVSADFSGAVPADSRRLWLGAGDDCAQFDGWLTTLDMSVEGTHFRLDWSSPEEAVAKCLLSNFSDIEAMGGTPRLALLGLCLSRDWSSEVRLRVADAFARGFAERGVALLGGDTVVGDQGAFSVTLLGTPGERRLLRSGARVGDDLYVAGSLGRSAAGLWLLSHHDAGESPWADELLRIHKVPEVAHGLGARLAAIPGMGACIDLSDGLSSELHHLALSSGVRMRIEENMIPVAPAVRAFCAARSLTERSFWLHGGEEYRLLFSCAPTERIILSTLLQEGGLHRIGAVLPGDGVELLTADGRLETIEAGAWSHL